MNTIINEKEVVLEIKKSKFISIIKKLDNIDSVKDIINDIKKEYPKANHYCYAYIFDEYKKSSDDKEPASSAGIPILEVLNKNELNHVLCVVVRYFGGIKLGVGGLIRAYTDSAKETLIDNIKEEKDYLVIEIISNYESQNKLDNLFKDYIISKDFKEIVTYRIELPVDKKELLNNIEYKLIETITK